MYYRSTHYVQQLEHFYCTSPDQNAWSPLRGSVFASPVLLVVIWISTISLHYYRNHPVLQTSPGGGPLAPILHTELNKACKSNVRAPILSRKKRRKHYSSSSRSRLIPCTVIMHVLIVKTIHDRMGNPNNVQLPHELELV